MKTVMAVKGPVRKTGRNIRKVRRRKRNIRRKRRNINEAMTTVRMRSVRRNLIKR